MSKNFWETERIRLRQVEPADWQVFHEWDADSEVIRNLWMIPFPKSVERYQQDIKNEALAEAKDDKFGLVIEEIETSTLAGSISSHTTDKRVGTFAYGLAIREAYQRRGYATEAILLLLKYFFEELRYQKCTVTIHEWNTASIVLHERLGFVKEGQLRRMLYTQGRHWDLLYYGLTVEEWREKYAKRPANDV
jgi:RimJ/RimL family protein N-acetyltransferase